MSVHRLPCGNRIGIQPLRNVKTSLNRRAFTQWKRRPRMYLIAQIWNPRKCCGVSNIHKTWVEEVPELRLPDIVSLFKPLPESIKLQVVSIRPIRVDMVGDVFIRIPIYWVCMTRLKIHDTMNCSYTVSNTMILLLLNMANWFPLRKVPVIVRRCISCRKNTLISGLWPIIRTGQRDSRIWLSIDWLKLT